MITVVTTPTGKPSIHDDLWHIVSSGNSGTTDFKYVYDLYYNGEQLARIKQFPDPNTSKGYFNPAPIIQGSITYDWFKPEDKIYLQSPDASGQMSLEYVVQYGEEVSGVTTSNLTSSTIRAYNWRPPLFKRRVLDLSQFDNKFVTNRPLTAKCALDSGEMLLIGVHSDTDVSAIINKYGYDNNLIAGDNSSTASVFDEYCQLNISPSGINGQLGAGFIDSNVKYYTVAIDGLNIEIRVDIICDGQYDVIPLHFINQYGMFETARFGLVSRLTMDVERKAFKQREYTFGATSVDYETNNVYRESKINYAQKHEYSYKLNMDAPTDAEYQWLAELITSPQIYAQIDGYYYPVTIKNSNYEFSTYLNNRLRVLELDIELNQTRYSHAR